ncbi:MAG: CopG family transcriptional regulator [Deltaproteobacteria bacterium]|jgi:metal-responsive CopG/Arc/MetJ family transcriptional regulator|nr:CopG family transcriptional regulator [Deltaproteobacteria bacterium]
MCSIQMTLNDDLVEHVDIIVKKLNMTRSAFTRKVLKSAIDYYKTSLLEKQYISGYLNKPVNGNEFSVWEDEQN